MKKTRVSTISDWSTDVVYSLFVEWLHRRGVFYAFRSNCGFEKQNKNAFRIMLCTRIQGALHSSYAGIGSLISMSFIFTHTPEGYAFWSDLSFDWRRFFTAFQDNFKKISL